MLRTPTRSRHELAFVVALILAVLAVTQVPYEVNRRLAPAGTTFADSLTFYPDYSSYFSFVRQSAEGRWLFEDRLTSEPHDPALFNLLWWSLGKVQGLFGFSWATMFHLWRALAAVASLATFWWLATMFLDRPGARRLALLVFATGGGLGWVFVLAKALGLPHGAGGWWHHTDAPGDTFGAFHPFAQIFLFPYHAVSAGMLVGSLALYIAGERRSSARYRIAAGLACAALGLVRPPEMVIVASAILAYAAFAAREDGILSQATLDRVWILVFPAPVLWHYVAVFTMHPVFRWMLTQNEHPPLAPLDCLLTIGLVGILALWKLQVLLSRVDSDPGYAILAAWLAAAFGLFFSYPIFRSSLEYGNALVAPVALLAFLPGAVVPVTARLRSVAIVVLFALNTGTSVWLLADKSREWQRPASGGFVDDGLLHVVEWLEQHSERHEVVLSLLSSSHWILRYGGNKVFIVNPEATVGFKAKAKMVRAFFDGSTPADVQAKFLEQFGVRFVLCGPEERKAGFVPDRVPGLRRVHASGDVELYETAVTSRF